MEGNLKEETKVLGIGVFQKRWVTLVENILSVFSYKNRRLLFVVDVSTAELGECEGMSPEFSVKNGMKVHRFRADSANTRQKWVVALSAAKKRSNDSEATTFAVRSLMRPDGQISNKELEVSALLNSQVTKLLSESLERIRQNLEQFRLAQADLAKQGRDSGSEAQKLAIDFLVVADRISSQMAAEQANCEIIRRSLAAMEQGEAPPAIPLLMPPGRKGHPLLDDEANNLNETLFSANEPPVLANQLTQSKPPVFLSPEIARHFSENIAFRKFPVDPDAPEVRLKLPAFKNPDDPFPIWKIIKQFIGKNLAKVALPVDICCPLSLLEFNTEFMRGESMFVLANNESDRYKRVLYGLGCVFLAVTNLSYRNKKPFNPILGETFELQGKGYRLICEQIRHHPPVCAYHVDAEDYEILGTVAVSPACKITGIEMTFEFKTSVFLRKTKETLTFKFPTVSFNNLLFGKMYLWLSGTMECINQTNGDRAYFKFEPRNKNPDLNYAIRGEVLNDRGEVKYTVGGRWDKYMTATDVATGETFEVISRGEEIPEFDFQYGFSRFTVQMNHLTMDLAAQLPKTDSRFRPDLRAFEYGDFDLAEEEKQRLEHTQRQRRKALEQQKKPYRPLWFDMPDPDSNEVSFNWKYWECKKNDKWPEEQMDIFG